MMIQTQRETFALRLAEDYRGQHQAPGLGSGSPMHDLSGTYPDDFYSHPAWYADGADYDAESIDAISSARGRPNRKINVYRTLPLDSRIPQGSRNKYPLNSGDWVTPSLSYAKAHGQSNMGKSPWTILQHEVPASHLFTDGNSVNEWGYDGPNVAASQHPWARAQRRKEEVKNTPVTPELMQEYVRNYFRHDDDDANTEFANHGWNEFNRRVDSGEFKPTYDATPKRGEQFPGTDHIYDMFGDMYDKRRTAMAEHDAVSLMVPMEHLDPHLVYDREREVSDDPMRGWRKRTVPLVEDVKKNGIRMPLTMSTDGHLGILEDGNHRAAAAKIAGLPAVPVRFQRADTRYLSRGGGVPMHPSIQQHLANNPEALLDYVDRQPSWAQGER